MEGPNLFGARIAVRWDGLTTGEDDATVAFVDGWMVVEGARTSFALRPCDVRVRWDLSVELAGGGWVSFVVGEHASAFRGALRDWGHLAESPAGEPVFPPARVHPAIVAREFAAAGVGIPFLLAAILLGVLSGASWTFGAAAFVCLLIGLLPPYLAWQAVARLRSRERVLEGR